MSCRVALLKLEKKGEIRLPEPKRKVTSFRSQGEMECLKEKIHVGFDELGDIELVLIPEGNRPLSRIWNEMMNRYHYLKEGPLCGVGLVDSLSVLRPGN